MTQTYIIKARGRYGKITYYVGKTNCPERRLREHRAGIGAKYLKGRECLAMIVTDHPLFTETFVKRLSHAEKRDLVENCIFHARNPEIEEWNPPAWWLMWEVE